MFVCDKEVYIVNKKNRIETIEWLFNAHYVGLYSHALSFVRDEEEAKDIVMDTYEYHKKFSTEIADYAARYKSIEHKGENISDAEFVAMDDFVIELKDFRTRFGLPK